jgi:hypothetical protein
MIVWYHYTIKQFYRQTNFVGDRHELSNGLYIGGKKEKKGRRVHQQSDILCDICAGCPIYQSYELSVQEMFGMQDWLILSLWIYISVVKWKIFVLILTQRQHLIQAMAISADVTGQCSCSMLRLWFKLIFCTGKECIDFVDSFFNIMKFINRGGGLGRWWWCVCITL